MKINRRHRLRLYELRECQAVCDRQHDAIQKQGQRISALENALRDVLEVMLEQMPADKRAATVRVLQLGVTP
jgi:hypothetical protein